MPSSNASHPGLDGFAVGLSTLCLVHCLVLPIVIASMPAFSTVLELPESLHIIAVLLAVPASTLALLAGFRHHGASLPALFAGIGLLLLGAGTLMAETDLIEAGLTVSGSVVLAFAHLHNWRLRRGGPAATGHRK